MDECGNPQDRRLNNKFIKSIINYKQMIVKSPCFQEKRRSIESRSHHVRHRSMGDQKLNVMDSINNSLTNRYLRTMQKQRERQLDNSNGEEGICFVRALVPKFIIKRKYLSFDVKQKSTLQDSQSKPKLRTTKYSKNKFDIIIDQYSDIKGTQRQSNCTELSQSRLFDNTGPASGPNLNKSKYKCIYIKRNRHKINMNPELMCKVKKAMPKQDNRPELLASDDWERRLRSKHFQGLDAFTYRTRFHSNNLDLDGGKKSQGLKEGDVVEQKEKKMFRPWSGLYPQDNF